MNTKIMSFAISLIIASFALSTNGLSTVFGEVSPYGVVGLEDQGHVYINDKLFVNVVFSQGEGQFMTLDQVVAETKDLIK